jgi:glycosyltransferase involved in cell wall biosynthesis
MRGSKLHLQVHTDLFDPYFSSLSPGNRLKVFLARFLLSRADSVRVVSRRIADSLAARGVRAPVTVLPVFVDLEGLKKAEVLDRRARYPHFKKLVLVVHGWKRKRTSRLPSGVAEIAKADATAGLVVVGSGSERVALENLARELGIGEKVVFEGAQDPFPFYKSADLVLVTPEYEGFGMVIVEALAAGSPVVSYDVGIAREAGAIIAKPEDLARVATAVLSEGKRGKLTLDFPNEAEYRELCTPISHFRLRASKHAQARRKAPMRGRASAMWGRVSLARIMQMSLRAADSRSCATRLKSLTGKIKTR